MLEKPLHPKAVIFDFDGTICDTEPCCAKYVARLFRSYGFEPTEEELMSMVGNDDAVTVPPILERAGVPYTIDDYFRDLSCRGVYFDDPLDLMEGSVAFIESLRARGILCAIASSTPSSYVVMALNRLGMINLFDAVVCQGMVERIKPEPDLYLKALGFLGVDARDCIAFEDSPSGIAAAHAAGVYTVAYTGSIIDQDCSAADALISSWGEAAACLGL